MVDNPVLTSPERIKSLFPGFASNNQSHRTWALQFLMELWEALFKDSGKNELIPGRVVTTWFDDEPYPLKLSCSAEIRGPNSSDDKLLLFPTDVVQILVGLAKKLDLPTHTTDYFFANAVDKDGAIKERSVLDTQTITDLERLYSEIRLKLNRLNRPAGAEEEETEEEKAEAEEPAKAAEAPTTAVATARVGPVPEGGGGEPGAEEPSEATADQPGTTRVCLDLQPHCV